MMDRDTPLYKPTRRGSNGIKSHQRQKDNSPASRSTQTSSKKDSDLSTTSHSLLDYLDTKYGVSADEHEIQYQQERRWSATHYDQPLQYDSSSESDSDDDDCSSRCSYSTISTHPTPGYLQRNETLQSEDEDEVTFVSPRRSRSKTRQLSRLQSYPEPRTRSSPQKSPRRCASLGIPSRNSRQHQSLPTIEEFQPQHVELSVRSLPSARTLNNVIQQRRRQHQQVAAAKNRQRRLEQVANIHAKSVVVTRRKMKSTATSSPTRSADTTSSDAMSLLVWDKDALQSCRDEQNQRSPRKPSRSRSRENIVNALPPPPPARSKSRSPKNKSPKGSPRSQCSSTQSNNMLPPKMPCRRASPVIAGRKRAC